MEVKTTINITWANGDTYLFDVCAMVSNNTETFLVGYNHQHSQYTALGLKENEIGQDPEEHHVYFVKQQEQMHYKDIIKLMDGTAIELLSDVRTGFWTGVKFVKTELTPERIGKLKYFEHYTIVSKTSDFFLKHSTGMYHKKATLIDYKVQ